MSILQDGGPYVDYGADLARPNGEDAASGTPEVRGGAYYIWPSVLVAGKSLGYTALASGPGYGFRLVQTIHDD